VAAGGGRARWPAVLDGGAAAGVVKTTPFFKFFFLVSLLPSFLKPFSHSKSPNINPRPLDLIIKNNQRKSFTFPFSGNRDLDCCGSVVAFVIVCATVFWVTGLRLSLCRSMEGFGSAMCCLNVVLVL